MVKINENGQRVSSWIATLYFVLLAIVVMACIVTEWAITTHIALEANPLILYDANLGVIFNSVMLAGIACLIYGAPYIQWFQRNFKLLETSIGVSLLIGLVGRTADLIYDLILISSYLK